MDPATREATANAGRAAVQAIQEAAANAAQKGGRSSELKVSILGLLMTGGIAAVDALAHIPGPWMLPAIAASAAISVAYAVSRAKVKAAALTAAGNVAIAAQPIIVNDPGRPGGA